MIVVEVFFSFKTFHQLSESCDVTMLISRWNNRSVLGNIFGDQFEWLWGLGPTSYFLYYNELVGFYSFEGVD